MSGDAMSGIGIYDGDTLIIDRSAKPAHDHIVLAVLDGEYMIRKLYKIGRTVRLIPESEHYRPIDLIEGMELQIFGIATARLRMLT